MEEGRRRRVRRLAEALSRLPASERALLAHAAEILERVSAGGCKTR